MLEVIGEQLEKGNWETGCAYVGVDIRGAEGDASIAMRVDVEMRSSDL